MLTDRVWSHAHLSGEQPGADRPDETTIVFRGGCQVDNHNVVRTQCRQQHLLDVQPEALAIDWPVDQPRRFDTIQAAAIRIPSLIARRERIPAAWKFKSQSPRRGNHFYSFVT